MGVLQPPRRPGHPGGRRHPPHKRPGGPTVRRVGTSNRARALLGVLIVMLLGTGIAAASVHDSTSSSPARALPAAPPASTPSNTTTTATTTVRLPHTL